MEQVKITYRLEGCLFPEKRKPLQDWFNIYHLLSEAEMIMLANAYKFNKESVQKLIGHTGKKFTYISKKGYEIVKEFHEKPIIPKSMFDKSQPLFISVEKILAEPNSFCF